MRGWAWGAVVVGLLCLVRGLALLMDPYPATTDAVGFSLVSVGALIGILALYLAGRGPLPVWLASAWIGCSIAALVLAYKDTLAEEYRVFGPWTLAGHAALQALIAPPTILLGFVVGFQEPDAWAYVLACIAIALLAGEILRRRLAPRTHRAPLRHAGGAGR